MGFGQLLLFEWVLLMASGFTLIGGKKGLLLSGLLLSILNLVLNPNPEFWKWEFILLLGIGLGSLVLELVNRKAEGKVLSGLVGGFISLVVFGVFATPLIALAVWALIVGTGLFPKLRQEKKLWELLPTGWRIMMALGWIIYGNLLYSF